MRKRTRAWQLKSLRILVNKVRRLWRCSASWRWRTAKKVFKGLRVFVNREVPLRPIYFTLLCGGATEVGWERGATAGGSSGSGSAFSVGNKTITHHIVDRPAEQDNNTPRRRPT